VSTVIPIKRLFEAHIIVRDLQRSLRSTEMCWMEVGIEQPERPAAFFWVGGRGKSMLGIFTLGRLADADDAASSILSGEAGGSPSGPQSYDLRHNPKGRRTPLPERRTVDEPIVFAWMPAASIIFDDPDGNLLDTLPCCRICRALN